MATKNRPMAIVELAFANIHKDLKDFFTPGSELATALVKAMPDDSKRAEYNAALAEWEKATGLTKSLLEKQLVSSLRTWSKGTFQDSTWSQLQQAKREGKLDAAIAEMRRTAVGAPVDTFGDDIRAIAKEFAMTDDECKAAIRSAGVAKAAKPESTPETKPESTPPAPESTPPAPESKPVRTGRH
jgi:hypothetical protein